MFDIVEDDISFEVTVCVSANFHDVIGTYSSLLQDTFSSHTF